MIGHSASQELADAWRAELRSRNEADNRPETAFGCEARKENVPVGRAEEAVEHRPAFVELDPRANLRREEREPLERETEPSRDDDCVRRESRAVGQEQPQLSVVPFDCGSSRTFPDPNCALDRASQPWRAAGPQDPLAEPASNTARERREEIGMQNEPVQRGRSVADHGIGESIEALSERAAGVVGLAIGEPVETRAHDQLHIGSGARGEERTLEATLTTTHDDHSTRRVGAVILKIGRERDVVSHLPVEWSRRRCERHGAYGDDERTDIDLVASVGREPEPSVCPLDGSDVRCVDVSHEARAEPVGIAEELLERYRFLARLVSRRRPAIERPGIPRRGEGRLVPVRPEAHVRRHAGAPGLHWLAIHPNPASVAKLGRNGEPIGPRTENRDIQALGHARTEAKDVSFHWSRRMQVPRVPYPLKASLTRARSTAWRARSRSIGLEQGVRVLFYHRVADDRDELAVSPRRFRDQMDYLAAEGYAVLDVTEVGALLRTGRVPERAVGLTFDDGCRDVAEHALPVLAPHNFRATVFVSTGVTDGRTRFTWYSQQPPLLTWSDIAELDRGGTLGFEAHSVTHPNLLAVDDVQADQEIAGSKAELEDRLGRRVTAFSYPSGLFGERERRLVERAGYALAVSCEPGINVPTTDRFALRRRQIDARDSLLDFRAKVAGAHDTPLPLRGLYRRVRYGDGSSPRPASARP